MNLWEDFWSDARGANIREVAQRAGAKLKPVGADWIGPCPNGCAKNDGLIVTPGKGRGIFLCRPSEATGDVIKLAQHVRGCSAIEAGEWITGRARPDHSRDETSEEREARLAMDAHRHEEEQRREEEQQRVEEAKAQRKAQKVEALHERGVEFADAPHAMDYFAARGLTPHPRLLKGLRYDSAVDYYGKGSNNGAGAPVLLATTPAVIADIRDASGKVIGQHLTHLDPNKPEKWKPIGDPNNSPRKIQGQAKGGMIRLGRPNVTMAIGEGIESVLAWHQTGRGPEDVALAAAVYLGNLKTVGLPKGVDAVSIIADNDSDPITLHRHYRAACEWFVQCGVRLANISIDWPPPGCDWNHALLHEARGDPLREDVKGTAETRLLRHPGGLETSEEFLERARLILERPEPSLEPEPYDRGAPQIGEPLDQFNWREPDPLPDDLLPVAPFDMAFLPTTIGPWVADIADLMQCPVDFVAIPAMVALAAVLGRKIAIRPQRHTDWEEVANLWGMIVGPPGSMKSPALADAMKPLRRLEMEAREKNGAAMKAFGVDAQEHKLRSEAAQKRFKAALKKDPDASAPTPIEEPVKPQPRRYIVDDATYEALGDILVNNPNGVLAYRDELVSLLRTLDREEYAAARGFFLAAWGGKEGYTFDRIIRGTQHIEAACVSLLGGTQPSKIADFVKRSIDGGQGDDGMIQRFSLVVWPNSVSWREVDRYADSAAKHIAFGVFERLDKLNPYAIGAKKGTYDRIPYLKFDRAAQEAFSTWHQHFERFVLRDDDLASALKGHFSKYRKLVPALALINFLADGGEGAISLDALARAIDFSRYLETHARRVYGAGAQNETTAAKAILTHVKRGDLADGFTARAVQRSDWSNLTDINQVKAGLELLVDLGWLADRPLKRPEGGRPTTAYFINPLGQRPGDRF